MQRRHADQCLLRRRCGNEARAAPHPQRCRAAGLPGSAADGVRPSPRSRIGGAASTGRHGDAAWKFSFIIDQPVHKCKYLAMDGAADLLVSPEVLATSAAVRDAARRELPLLLADLERWVNTDSPSNDPGSLDALASDIAA